MPHRLTRGTGTGTPRTRDPTKVPTYRDEKSRRGEIGLSRRLVVPAVYPRFVGSFLTVPRRWRVGRGEEEGSYRGVEGRGGTSDRRGREGETSKNGGSERRDERK